MLDCDVKNGWDQFLSFIESRLPSSEFQNWIQPIRCIDAAPEMITLEVPNIYVEEYLLTHFKDILADFFPLLPSGEPAIRFQMGTSPKEEIGLASITVEEDPPPFEARLNPLYIFENFIEGPSNQFVKSAAFGVASRPGKSYNPLFIHGGVGLGKTHLLHSIGHYVQEHHKKQKVQLITTEGFINDIVHALPIVTGKQIGRAHV